MYKNAKKVRIKVYVLQGPSSDRGREKMLLWNSIVSISPLMETIANVQCQRYLSNFLVKRHTLKILINLHHWFVEHGKTVNLWRQIHAWPTWKPSVMRWIDWCMKGEQCMLFTWERLWHCRQSFATVSLNNHHKQSIGYIIGQWSRLKTF